MSLIEKGLRPRKLFMTADAVGGVWTYSLELARSFGEIGIETVLAVLGPDPDRTQLNQAAEIANLSVLPTGLPLDWTAASGSEVEGAARELKVLAARACADLAHLNAPAHAGSKAWPIPLVVAAHSCVGTWWQAVHGGAPLPDDLAWRAERTRAGLHLADAVLAPSRAFATALAERYGADLPIVAVHNGRTSAQRASDERHAYVVTAGRLWDPGKDVATLDAAAGLLPMPVFAAGPMQGPNGESLAWRHLVPLGNLTASELALSLSRASAFVSVAKYEPFGLAVLEAAQSGTALILSDIPTFRELWDGAALFVPPGDAHALAARIESVSSDPLLRAELGRSALERAQSYCAAKMASGVLRVYAGSLAAERRVPAMGGVRV